ncbi:hypothetical protein FISHEDRAFT_52091, partial [Fistulina hepatica ATCC 64428]
KNIAEKLITSTFQDWKILVASEFAADWHSHLYADADLQNHLIQSSEFFSYKSKKLLGCKVFLCTLAMLSNNFVQKKFMKAAPLHSLVVDEASQIQIGDYIAVFSNMYHDLHKVIFIGDDKQYRMPPQLGNHISHMVYDDQLKSNAMHPIKDDVFAVRFIDVDGREEYDNGQSRKNDAEVEAVVKLVQVLGEGGVEYRVITPYDAQRALIEKTLQERELPWENTCFNVDSFQGNEADYIVISLVRVKGLGFLNNMRRTNVMLTRCRKGMIIVTNKRFLQTIAADTLVGKLAQELGDTSWLTFAEKTQFSLHRIFSKQ